MRLKEDDLLDIAIDKKAFQSSYSKWSKNDDPLRAIKKELEFCDYAFHTNYELNPWWMVDLEKEYPIELIRVTNRIYAAQDVATNLIIEISKDNKNWILVHKGMVAFFKAGLESEFVLPKPLKARYVRVTLNGRGYLHLLKIQVMIRKSYKPLFIAGRIDGFGCRIIAMLNAMYLAEKESANFGFVWPEKTNFNGEVFEKEKESNFIGRKIGKENEIFSDSFIHKFSYTNSGLNHNYGIVANDKISYSQLLKEKNFSDVDYIYYISSVNLGDWIKEINKEDYYKSIKRIWNSIEFSNSIQLLREQAKNIAQNLQDFIALHIRGGDIIVADGFKNLGNWWWKAMPVEIAMAIIEKTPNSVPIVLFGDDEGLINSLENLYKNRNVFSVNSLFDTKKINDVEKVIFEISLMSYALKIYTSGSNFARLASLIAFAKEPEHYFKSFSAQDRYINVKENLEKIKLNHYQMAYSYFYMFMLSRELKLDIKERLYYVKRALFFDPDNDLYRLGILECLLLNKKYKSADRFVKICFYRLKRFMPIFLNSTMILRKNLFILLKEVEDRYMYLSYLKMCVFCLEGDNSIALKCFNKIKENKFLQESTFLYFPKLNIKTTLNQNSEKYFEVSNELIGAKARIQNQLSYKLGQAMIENSKSILGYIRMPYVLSYIKDKHKQEQKIYEEKIKKDPSLKLPPLESYPDYKEALKFKEHLSYKLGEALIKANRNWYGGGVY